MLGIHGAATVWRMERWTEPYMAERLDEALMEALTGGDWLAVLGGQEAPAIDLEGAPLAGRDLSGIDLRRADLQFADLSDTDLTGAVLSKVSARFTDFTGATLADADFTGTQMLGNAVDPIVRATGSGYVVGMRDLHFTDTWFPQAPRHSEAQEALAYERQVSRARWAIPEQSANLDDVVRAAKNGEDWTDARYPAGDGNYNDLQGAPLAGRDLRGADLFGAELDHADLRGADLTGARLAEATITGADLTGAILDRATITRSVLSRSDLTGARLHGATITDTLVLNAILDDADFTGATITNTTLYGTSRTGTRLDNAAKSNVRT
ncbi:pentapeptide repeat-containing protein [Actinomadura rupiterrae]|uniref:pentapeptide repeat-containing protein n=1 Tax=Actinomadura rupiterrae TaxID=559627 RepID=UPI0020A59613|nr:pentapeptide repeat-containing protein [Actinomadura rupiterrae]MCP2343635.1 uncharacterized protein YjbI with pentapeptide repeats [Actinomadura rupiterrae]